MAESRSEDILAVTLGLESSEVLVPPESRIEDYLQQLLEQMKHIDGKTAYEYAVEKGYTGTEEQFASMMASYGTVAEQATDAADRAIAAVEEVEDAVDDISYLKSHVDEIENVKMHSVISLGSQSGTRMKQINVNIAAGLYTVKIDSVTSADTDSSICRVAFQHSDSTADNMFVTRGSNWQGSIWLKADITSVIIYASDNYAHSADDTFAFTGITLYASDALRNAVMKTFTEDVHLTEIPNLDFAASATVFSNKTGYSVGYFPIRAGVRYLISINNKSTTGTGYYRQVISTAIPSNGLGGSYITQGRGYPDSRWDFVYTAAQNGYYSIARSPMDTDEIIITALGETAKDIADIDEKIGTMHTQSHRLRAEDFEQGSINNGCVFGWNTECITTRDFFRVPDNAEQIVFKYAGDYALNKRINFFDESYIYQTSIGFTFDDAFVIPEEAVYYKFSLSFKENGTALNTTPDMLEDESVEIGVTVANTVTFEAFEEVRDNTYKLAAATEGCLEITDGYADALMKHLIVEIKPIQAGSGTPSGDNVRTISKQSAITLNHSGINISDAVSTEISLAASPIARGTLDVITGKIVETYGLFIADGTGGVGTISTSGDALRFWGSVSSNANFSKGTPMSDKLSKAASYSSAVPYTWGFDANYPTNFWAWLPYGGNDGVQEATVAGVKAWLAAHPIQVVVMLNTPIEHDITETPIRTLLGVNRFWADVDVVSCEYMFDTKLLMRYALPIPPELPQYEYTGERIRAANHVACEHMFDLSSEYPIVGTDGKKRTRQGGAAYGDYLFVAYNGYENISVYDLRTGSHVYNIPINETYQDGYHCNNLNFGYERYSADDEFPLLYIASNASAGYCDVYRIVRDGSTFTATRVQRITLPPLIQGQTRNRFACVDADNKYLYIEGTTSGTTGAYTDQDKHRFARYNLPKLSEGDVTLSYGNKLFEFDIPCLDAYQGGAVVNGKYLEVDGYTHSSWIQQIDLNAGKLITAVSLWDMGIAADGKDEPEASFIWDNHVCLYTVYGHVYKLYFD